MCFGWNIIDNVRANKGSDDSTRGVLPERPLLHLRLSMYMHMHMLHMCMCMCSACALLVAAGCPSLRGVVGRRDRLQRRGLEGWGSQCAAGSAICCWAVHVHLAHGKCVALDVWKVWERLAETVVWRLWRRAARP